MDRRRRNFTTIDPQVLGGKVTKKETKKSQPKNLYKDYVENSVKKLVDREEKPYSVTTVPINEGGKKFTFEDISEPIDLQITDKSMLRFKIVKSNEEEIFRVDIRTMVLKNNQWTYTQRGINFELGYIEEVIMSLVDLANIEEEELATV